MPGQPLHRPVLKLGTPPQRLGLIVGKPESHRHVTDATVRFAAPRCERVQGLPRTSNPSESIDLLTAWLISADFVANALREHQEGYNVRSDEGDEARCGRCYTTTVRR